ncbi:MAG: hypothetical protein UU73_C0001G0269 [Candidatus Daviesbacteria bacterium GW2011_GWA1_41_61]|uniref:Uncharacterized protein n=1 Tax=Candidatus Daviesbacteria bacterium GW2011_GWA2_40_9 TaxID=1618424 RepID=A0A0G0WGR2_9BACT|nr:MAG: hypothetical protein UU26_C0013G0022 [Candidatus Daviesbacteria bacterium GW2011_GWC1_40_9]KKR83520.1 MAG: hypothetical protein UU29_C0004G0021 [Candidatus Daviesbacteria bacterium GW2011_GWA2_40_9]KKR93088.1 MAG: hypothetical protein UU44_C0004G0270 [Candidatus Daviesbacteria bacterium GW2011_GWB1_41_15]KKS15632.1 MAG: hypothetical protein UU73_C0001G0269 [Candidatus Daviesbacteria bacterium GW2011_GWA1_41_61]
MNKQKMHLKNGINWGKSDKGFVKQDSLKGLKRVQIGDLLITSAGHSSEKIGEAKKLQREQLQELEALQQSVLHQAFQGKL